MGECLQDWHGEVDHLCGEVNHLAHVYKRRVSSADRLTS